jgi:ribonuclease HI
MDMEKGLYQLHIDGGRQHPKDEQQASAAISYVLCDSRGRELEGGRRSKTLDPPVEDSTSAEYEAALAGLEDAFDRGIAYIAIFTDSRNLVNQLSGRFRSSAHLASYARRLKAELGKFADWQVSWIPREWNKAHSGVRKFL